MDSTSYSDSGSVSRPELSVIIVNYNTGDHLRTCVESLKETTQDISLEMIIIDNASTDDSVEGAHRSCPEAQVIRNSRNEGFAAACNRGICAASGEHVLLLNPDTIILPDAIKKSLAFLRETARAGIVGCRLLDQEGRGQISYRSFPTVWDYLFDILCLTKLFPKSKLFGRFYLTNRVFDKPTEVDMVQGAFFLINRAVLDDIGLLDEQFFMYAEERDYCYRAKARGWKVFIVPEAKSIHIGGVSTRQQSSEMLIERRRSTILFHQKHDRATKTFLIKSIIFIGTFIRYIGWNVIAMVKGTPRVKSMQRGYKAATRWFFQTGWSLKAPITPQPSD